MQILKKEIVLNSKNIPKHIALIMDGNGRWAKNRGMPRTFGHKSGAERIGDILKECIELDVKAVTIYAFSIENWKRDILEIEYIFNLLIETFNKKEESIMKNNIKVNVIGNISKLDGKYEYLKNKIKEIMDNTRNNTGLILNVAFNYSSHDEIVKAIKSICSDVVNNRIILNNINEDLIENYLMTNGTPNIDLLIRTSGEKRLSNFLLWQIAYTELVFTDTYWPDFSVYEFRKCIYEYQRRDRRYGNVK